VIAVGKDTIYGILGDEFSYLEWMESPRITQRILK